ncbi:hypothetical protein T06_144 [Trichinella sp. T6]|nr:hypothetical protein T06_144 [Trichinella sp. T6]
MLWKERMRFFIGICEFLILFTIKYFFIISQMKLYIIKEISFFLHEMCCDRFKQDEEVLSCMYMFLSHIEYLLECNTLAVNRIPLTGTKNVATKLALDGPFVYGQHLMILALD